MSESGFRQTGSDYGPHTEQVTALIEWLGALAVTEAFSVPDVTGREHNGRVKKVLRRILDATDKSVQARRGVLASAMVAAVEAADASAERAGSSITPRWDRDGCEEWANACRAGMNAVIGLAMRDLLDAADYYLLTEPMRTLFGPLHPDDPEVAL